MSEALWERDMCDVADSVRNGRLKAADLLETCLERIERFDPEINAFVALDPQGARAQAEEVDRRVQLGEDPGPLAGIPIGVKDLEDAAGLPTRRGSLLFDAAPADADSRPVARLRQAGAVIVGKTATPEFGSLAFTWSRATGTTRNPWRIDRTPGGSSGGSAAALTAGLVPLATGSDGGGSIRIPASFCGLVGLKASTGLIARRPRRGWGNLSAYGPLTRSVRDAARVLDQVTGLDSSDPASLPKPTASYESCIDSLPPGLRVAWSSSLGFGRCDPEVAVIARAAAQLLFEAGGMKEIERPVDLPDVSSAWVATSALDLFTELEHLWASRAADMTPVVEAMMQIGAALRPHDVAEAARLRFELLQEMNEVFRDVDLIVTPTMPTTAFAAEGPMPEEIAGTPIDNPFDANCFTFPFNITGHPAISLPAGIDGLGLPVGIQIVGRRLSEPWLLGASRHLERSAPWPKIAPPFTDGRAWITESAPG